MQISMTLPQSRRRQAIVNGELVTLEPGSHALLEVLLMNRGLWVEWETLCVHAGVLPHPGWRGQMMEWAAALRSHGIRIDHAPRTGFRLPLDVERIYKLKVAA